MLYNLEENDFIFLNGKNNSYLFDVKITYYVLRNEKYDIHSFNTLGEYLYYQLEKIEFSVEKIINNINYNLDKHDKEKDIINMIRENNLYKGFKKYNHKGFADNSKTFYSLYIIFLEIFNQDFINNKINQYGKVHKFDSYEENLNFFKQKDEHYFEWDKYKKEQLKLKETMTAIFPSYMCSHSENLVNSLKEISENIHLYEDKGKFFINANEYNTIFVFVDSDFNDCDIDRLKEYNNKIIIVLETENSIIEKNKLYNFQPYKIIEYKKQDITWEKIHKFQYDCTKIIARNVEFLEYSEYCKKYYK